MLSGKLGKQRPMRYFAGGAGVRRQWRGISISIQARDERLGHMKIHVFMQRINFQSETHNFKPKYAAEPAYRCQRPTDTAD